MYEYVLLSFIVACAFVDVSLLERLMTQNDLYKRDDVEFDKRYVSKLIMNYR